MITPHTRKHPTIFEQIIGWLLIILGVLGFVIPFLPGWLLIIAGLVLIGHRKSIHSLRLKCSQYYKKFRKKDK
ncbi:MAG: PGPGW domain-containing protein [Nanoarchaeota archaeon]